MGEQKNVQTQDVNQLLKVRREKLAELQQNGQDPFVITKYEVTHHSQEVKDHFDELEGKQVSLAGRMMSKRVMGKASFCNIQDLQGNIQCYVARDSVGEESYKGFQEDGYRRYCGTEGGSIQDQDRRDFHPCIRSDTALQEPSDSSGEVSWTDQHRSALSSEICGFDHESGSKGYFYQTFKDY